MVAVSSRKKFEWWSLTRELLKQYLTEKQTVVFTKWSLTGGGRLREVVAMRELTVVYFNSFYGLRLVDFDPFWFLFPIHKVRVPLLLLYMKTNC